MIYVTVKSLQGSISRARCNCVAACVGLNMGRYPSTRVKILGFRPRKFIFPQDYNCNVFYLEAQATQTLFVIYIRDSIALRFEPFRECRKRVRKRNSVLFKMESKSGKV